MDINNDSHDDKSQDMDMIAQVLHKIADDMQGLEAGRFHPSAPVSADVHAEVEPNEGTPEEESSPEDLQELLGQSDKANDDGSMPDDHDGSLPPAIAALVAEKKKKLA